MQIRLQWMKTVYNNICTDQLEIKLEIEIK